MLPIIQQLFASPIQTPSLPLLQSDSPNYTTPIGHTASDIRSSNTQKSSIKLCFQSYIRNLYDNEHRYEPYPRCPQTYYEHCLRHNDYKEVLRSCAVHKGHPIHSSSTSPHLLLPTEDSSTNENKSACSYPFPILELSFHLNFF